ncbi:MAG: hypothetical protein KKA65_05700 [Nanoarchaeota archaeon]|nr:hypothetical protein [Nanoarchaeota archaeon]MBU4352440.1 hypothetical protein [Nanoarchaeota archaeon]MBU4456965.1 hypothetical protein [Nanoarchaeota archaeon]MCG2720032.1 hypothetical protein [Nanoarchaeota archaeon]
MKSLNLTNYGLIFIGETHGFIEDFNKQKEIIEIVNPDLILSEQMQDLKLNSKYQMISILKQNNLSDMVELKEVKKLIRLCMKKSIKIRGIDFKNFGLTKRLKGIIKEGIEPTKEDIAKFEIIAKKREHRHLKIIEQNLKKTKKPIIVLLGSWHLRDDSLLMKKLKNYIVIYPCIKKGEVLIEPPKHKRPIKYCYKIKK